MEEYSRLNWNDHSGILLSKLHNMFETNAFVDLTLVSDEGLSIQVHRVILCAASPYFQDLFSEHPADTHTTIILSNVSFEHLRALVEFIYKGTVYRPRSQLPDLLESATSMKIKGLTDTIKYSQQQHDSQAETDQPKSDGTLLKIVSVKSITQMPSQAGHQPMSCENHEDEVVVKEELGCDPDATVAYEPEQLMGSS